MPITNSYKEHLKLLPKPYPWAVQSELLKGNINQVNLYAKEMAKEKNLQNIVVTNDKRVIISSPEKNEGLQFANVRKSYYLNIDTTLFENIDDSTLVMSGLVMVLIAGSNNHGHL